MRPETTWLLNWLGTLYATSSGGLLYVRLTVGWSSMLLGVLGVILPILPGWPFLFVGVYLIGPRDYRIRWVRVRYCLLLRYITRADIPLLSNLSRLAQRTDYQLMRQLREWHNQPLPALPPQQNS